MISLYHGSTEYFDEIDLSKGKGFKDFGKGFYATAVADHAERLARRNKGILIKRQEMLKRQGKISRVSPVIAYRYDLLFDDSSAGDLRIKRFLTADVEWLKFIVMNRSAKDLIHDYDIVIGPTADAQTVMILNNYQEELEQSGFAESICLEVIRELEPENLPKQYLFATEAAIKLLTFKSPGRRVIG